MLLFIHLLFFFPACPFLAFLLLFLFSFLPSLSVCSVQAETDQGPVVGHSSGDMAGSSGICPSAIEGMLLMAVEKLYKEDREPDVQMGLLRVVLQVLQRHGTPCSSSTTITHKQAQLMCS